MLGHALDCTQTVAFTEHSTGLYDCQLTAACRFKERLLVGTEGLPTQSANDASVLVTMDKVFSTLISFAEQWWLRYATGVGNQEQPVMFLPRPLALGGVLLMCGSWLWRESRRAGWWPLVTLVPALAPRPDSGLSR